MGSHRTVLAALVVSVATTLAQGAQVGAIYGCYACQNTGNTAIDSYLATGAGGATVASDGILFAFANTSTSAITGGVFSVSAGVTDSFQLPSIAPGSTFILVPGITNDGVTHPANGFFNPSAGVLDTSDGGGAVTDSSVWSFTGMDGGVSVSTGAFTAGQPNLILPFRDNPANGSTSFLGLGPSGDGGCSNCYYGPLAAIDTASGGTPTPTSTPEPAGWGLLIAGFGALTVLVRRR